MMCDKQTDAWVYFVVHPNSGLKEVLEKCDVELISLSKSEIKNFFKILPFLQEKTIAQEFYPSLPRNILTIATPTIIASKKSIDPQIVKMMRDIFDHHKNELVS